jgi:hypothetical protein
MTTDKPLFYQGAWWTITEDRRAFYLEDGALLSACKVAASAKFGPSGPRTLWLNSNAREAYMRLMDGIRS